MILYDYLIHLLVSNYYDNNISAINTTIKYLEKHTRCSCLPLGMTNNCLSMHRLLPNWTDTHCVYVCVLREGYAHNRVPELWNV